MKNYYWFVNLDERGYFSADVRDENGKTVYDVRNEDDGSIPEMVDGYMVNKEDLNGLAEYLQQLEILPSDSRIVDGIKAGK